MLCLIGKVSCPDADAGPSSATATSALDKCSIRSGVRGSTAQATAFNWYHGARVTLASRGPEGCLFFPYRLVGVEF